MSGNQPPGSVEWKDGIYVDNPLIYGRGRKQPTPPIHQRSYLGRAPRGRFILHRPRKIPVLWLFAGGMFAPRICQGVVQRALSPTSKWATNVSPAKCAQALRNMRRMRSELRDKGGVGVMSEALSRQALRGHQGGSHRPLGWQVPALQWAISSGSVRSSPPRREDGVAKFDDGEPNCQGNRRRVISVHTPLRQLSPAGAS